MSESTVRRRQAALRHGVEWSSSSSVTDNKRFDCDRKWREASVKKHAKQKINNDIRKLLFAEVRKKTSDRRRELRVQLDVLNRSLSPVTVTVNRSPRCRRITFGHRLSLLQARWSGTHYRLSFAICLSVLASFGALLRRYYSRDISASSAIAMYPWYYAI